MAVIPFELDVMPSTASTEYITVPAGRRLVITSLIITNRNIIDSTIVLTLGAVVFNSNKVLQSQSNWIKNVDIVLEPGDKIIGAAMHNGTIHLMISGYLFDIDSEPMFNNIKQFYKTNINTPTANVVIVPADPDKDRIIKSIVFLNSYSDPSWFQLSIGSNFMLLSRFVVDGLSTIIVPSADILLYRGEELKLQCQRTTGSIIISGKEV